MSYNNQEIDHLNYEISFKLFIYILSSALFLEINKDDFSNLLLW